MFELGDIGKIIGVKLIPKKIKVEQLYLDPNNLRLVGLTRLVGTPEARAAEIGVQNSILEDLKKHAEIKMLRDSILQVGFLPIDRVVIKALDSGKYMVLEGNRRISALKWILEDYERGELTLDEKRVHSLMEVEVILAEGPADVVDNFKLLVQGIRHIAGIEAWEPYQKAVAANTLYEGGMEPNEIKLALGGGISIRAINSMIRALRALKRMEEDEDYGVHARPDMYSYFDEAVKKPYLRDTWLRWYDEEGKFLDDENLKLFYSWITPSEELDGNKKISTAMHVRDLPSVLEDPELRAYFLRPNVDIRGAISRRDTMRELTHWRDELRRFEGILPRIPVEADFRNEDIKLMERIAKRLDEIIARVRRIKTRKKSVK